MKNLNLFLVIVVLILALGCNSETRKSSGLNWAEEWPGRVYPPEHIVTTDSVSGAKVVFVTTNPAKDLNFYFDWNSWFRDQSCLFFTSDRNGKVELFGYIPKTGELVCFSPENSDKNYWFGTVDFQSHDIYMTGNNTVIGWNIDIQFNKDSSKVEKVKVGRGSLPQPLRVKTFLGHCHKAPIADFCRWLPLPKAIRSTRKFWRLIF